jgi:hypothetical protein
MLWKPTFRIIAVLTTSWPGRRGVLARPGVETDGKYLARRVATKAGCQKDDVA